VVTYIDAESLEELTIGCGTCWKTEVLGTIGVGSYGELTHTIDGDGGARKGIASEDDSLRHDLSHEVSKRLRSKGGTSYDVGWLEGEEERELLFDLKLLEREAEGRSCYCCCCCCG
jgi:hypothetical protein